MVRALTSGLFGTAAATVSAVLSILIVQAAPAKAPAPPSAAPPSAAARSVFDHSHSLWTETLGRAVDAKGLVNYRALMATLKTPLKTPLKTSGGAPDGDSFTRYLSILEAVSERQYESWSKDERLAFLINAYNAFTVKLIVDHYPVKSIKDIGGFFSKPWSKKFFRLFDGKIQSLDPIEHEWIRPKFKDYRIHAAVNCAAQSCPQLRNEAYVADRLSAQLDQQMEVWLSDPNRNDFGRGASISISKIFDWYEKDFTDWGDGVIPVINRFRKGMTPIPSGVKIKYLNYSWALNEARAP
jgi:hypothetical protein